MGRNKTPHLHSQASKLAARNNTEEFQERSGTVELTRGEERSPERVWPVFLPACQSPLLSESARGDRRAGEMRVDSGFQALTAAVATRAASFIVFLLLLIFK